MHIGVAGPALLAASLQVAGAAANVGYVEYQPICLSAANQFLKRPLVCEQGFFSLPDGPGLGIEIDEEAVQSHIINDP